MDKEIKQGAEGCSFLAAALGIPVLVMAVCAAVIIFADPFFHYHAPIEGFPYIIDNELSQNPGMASNMSYEGLITGSSMTMSFHTEDFKSLMGLDMIKLPYPGAYPADIATILTAAFDEKSRARRETPLKEVVISIDNTTLTADTDEHKFDLPEYLYDRNVINDVNYVLNREVLWEYVLRPVVQRKKTDLNTVYDLNFTPEEYDSDLVLEGYEPAPREEGYEKDALIPRTQACLEADFLPFIKEHEETEFICFFPAYSILYWNDMLRRNKVEATLEQTRFVAESLMAYPNVRIFFFQDMEEFVTDLDNYADYTHYVPEFNSYMVKCFSDGTHEVTSPDELAGHLEETARMVREYDFDALHVNDES